MNSVIAGERWIASRAWEGIASAGKINPAAAEGDCQDCSVFFMLWGFFALKKRAAHAPRSQADDGSCWGAEKEARKEIEAEK